MSVEDLKSALDNTSDDLVDTAAQSESQLDDASSEAGDSEAVVVAQAGDDATPVDAADSESATEAASDGASPIIVTANDQNQVLLPAGTSLDDVVISGAELILLQPDGTEIIIRNGALNVPTFIIDNIEIPQEALVAAFANSGIDIAAGPDGTLIATAIPEGAGADFLISPGDIGDAGPLIDLLGRTELSFPVLEDRELFPDEREDGAAGSSNNPVSVVATSILATDEVSREAGINETATQRPGSDEIADGDGFNDSSDLEVSSVGQITVDAPDGLAELLINGFPVDLNAPETVIDGTYGFLTVTPINVATGEFEYFYTATKALDHPLNQDILTETFTVEATDSNGDSASTTFEVGIFDDVPSVGVTAETDISAFLDEGDQDQGSPSTGVPSVIDTGSIVKGDDPDVPNTGGAAISSAVTSASPVNIDAIFGADGEAATNATQFALSLSSNASGVTLTDGSPIVLVDVNGDGSVIVGQVQSGAFAGTAAFALQIDPGTGLVTVEQYLSLAHPAQHDGSATGQSYDEPVDLADSGLEVVVTITDGDGDQAQAFANVGAQIQFEDDGPKAEADAKATLDMAVVDESSDVFTGTPGSGTDGIQSVKIGLADNFLTAAYGADGAGTTTYALVLSAQNIGSGLFTTDTTAIDGKGAEILLSQSGNVITGSVGGDTYFTITIDPATGEATFALESDAPIWHADTGNHDDASVLTIDPQDGTLVIRQTVTDGDGDSALATVDLSGDVFKVEDDGPTAGSVSVSGETAYLDESIGTDGSQQDENNNALPNDEAGVTDPFDAKNFGTMIGFATLAAALTVTVSGNAGADGLGSETVDLTDGGGNAHNGTATSLSLSSTGQTIYLFTVDGIVVGRAGDNATDAETGPVAFAIGIDGISVEIAQYAALTHSNTSSHDDAVGLDQLVYVSVTTTDSDGDTAVATSGDALSISFEDDGPDAVDDSAQLLQGQTDFNIVFVLDFSSSISNAELDTMLNAVELAGQAFFDGAGDVQIHLVPFASTAISAGPFTDFTSFVNQLEAWNPADGGTRPFDRGTDFTAGIEETLDVYTPLAGYNNQVFFLSDGNPNQQLGTGGHSLADPTRVEWNSFVTNNDITVQTIGIGNNLTEDRLQDLDEADGDNTVLNVATFDDLVDALVNLANVETVSGNALLGDDGVVGGGDDDSFGEDGGRILSIQVGTVLYTYDATAGEITNDGGDPTQSGSSLTVTTPEGRTLEFDFATGAWAYSSNGTTGTGVEAFEYTLIDNDGDTSSATLSVEVVLAPAAVRDIVLTNITDFSPIDIPNEALLNNDIEVNNPLSVNSVGNPTNGTVSPGAQFDPSVQLVTRVYDFDGVTRDTNDHFAYEFEFDPPGGYDGLSELTSEVGIGGPGAPSASEATNDDYEDIAEDGNGDWDLPDPGSGDNNDHAVFWSQFAIDEDANSITEIAVTIDARSTDNGSDLGIWNYTTSQWVLLDGSGNGSEWSGSITTDIEDYLDPSTNQLTVAFVNALDDDPFKVDYIRVEVTAPETAFSSGSFDYEVTDGNGFTDTASVGITGVDGNTVTGTDEDEILIGNDSGSTLDGAGGNDFVIGGAGADTLIGGDGEDILAGGLGVDLLWGGSLGGSGDGDIDTFVIDDATAVDIIGDFESGVDEIDLTALLNGLPNTVDPVADGYVQVVQNGNDAEVQVDTDGSAGGVETFETVVTLQNFDSNSETVRILYNDADGDKGTNV